MLNQSSWKCCHQFLPNNDRPDPSTITCFKSCVGCCWEKNFDRNLPKTVINLPVYILNVTFLFADLGTWKKVVKLLLRHYRNCGSCVYLHSNWFPIMVYSDHYWRGRRDTVTENTSSVVQVSALSLPIHLVSPGTFLQFDL